MQHLTVLISHGFGNVFSNPQSTTNSTIPKMHTPCNPKPCKTPNQQPLPWGLAKSKSYIAAATVGSHEPELAVPRHPRAVPKSQPGHRPWEPGEDEGGGSTITSALVIFFNSERFQNLSDTHVCNCRGLSHSMHVRGVGGVRAGWQEPQWGLRGLLRKVLLQQTDLWA